MCRRRCDSDRPHVFTAAVVSSTIIIHRHSRRLSSLLPSCVASLSTLSRRLLLLSRHIRMPGHLLSFFPHPPIPFCIILLWTFVHWRRMRLGSM